MGATCSSNPCCGCCADSGYREIGEGDKLSTFYRDDRRYTDRRGYSSDEDDWRKREAGRGRDSPLMRRDGGRGRRYSSDEDFEDVDFENDERRGRGSGRGGPPPSRAGDNKQGGEKLGPVSPKAEGRWVPIPPPPFDFLPSGGGSAQPSVPAGGAGRGGGRIESYASPPPGYRGSTSGPTKSGLPPVTEPKQQPQQRPPSVMRPQPEEKKLAPRPHNPPPQPPSQRQLEVPKTAQRRTQSQILSRKPSSYDDDEDDDDWKPRRSSRDYGYRPKSRREIEDEDEEESDEDSIPSLKRTSSAYVDNRRDDRKYDLGRSPKDKDRRGSVEVKSAPKRSFASRLSSAWSGSSEKSPKSKQKRASVSYDKKKKRSSTYYQDSDSETDSAYLSDEDSDESDYDSEEEYDEEYERTRRWVMGAKAVNDSDEDIDDLFNQRFGKGKSKKDREKERKDKRKSSRASKFDSKSFPEMHEGVRTELTELEKKKWEGKEAAFQEAKRKELEEQERKRKEEEEREKERRRQEEEAQKKEILRYYSTKPEKMIVRAQAYIRGHLAKKRVRFYAQESQRRHRICIEMRDSEQSYFTVLTYLVEDFYEPLMKIANEGGADPMVTVEQVQAIFSNIVEIKAIHTDLLDKLVHAMEHWYPLYNIAGLYIDLAKHLYIYTSYINGYDKAMQTLQSLQSTKPAFKEFIERQEKVREKKQDIFSLLINPVQRIPRYELLLRDLSKRTWPDHAGYEDLVKALKEITVVNTFINNEKRKIDNKVRMYEIHADLKGIRNAKIKKILIQEHRRFLREGLLQKKKKGYISSVRQTDKWMFLFNDIILVSLVKKKLSKNTQKPYQSHNTKMIDLDGATVTLQKDGVSFIITSPGSGKTLWIAKNQQERDDWVKAIQASIDETKDLIKKGVVIQKEEPRQSGYLTSLLPFGGAKEAELPPGVEDDEKEKD